MAKFQVLVTETVIQRAMVDVEADTLEQAREKALLEVGLGMLDWDITTHNVDAEVTT